MNGPDDVLAAISDPAAAIKDDVLERYGVVPISSIAKEPIDWAWPGRFAFGKHTDLSGDPGDGKSLMLGAVAAQITRGLALPYGSTEVREPRSVIYFSTEDDNADTIRPRFEAAGGELNRLYVQKDTHHLILPNNTDDIRDIIRDLKAGMVVFDPLFSYIGELDSNKYDSAVAVCDPLKRIASETRCIVATVRHLNKMNGTAARYRAGGSQGWQAKPRIVLSLGRDPDDREVRVLTCIKGNVAEEPKAATFRVDTTPVDGEPVVRVVWGSERDITADEVHGCKDAQAAAKKQSKVEALTTYLRDRGIQAGEEGLMSEELLEDARKLGLETPKGRGTFYQARGRAGFVEMHRTHPIRIRLRPIEGNAEEVK